MTAREEFEAAQAERIRLNLAWLAIQPYVYRTGNPEHDALFDRLTDAAMDEWETAAKYVLATQQKRLR